MKIKTIRQRNKRQIIYGYTYKAGSMPEVSRRIATRDTTRVGVAKLDNVPTGTNVLISHHFRA